MSTQQNKELVQRYLSAISGKEKTADVIDEYVADEELKQHLLMFDAAFPRYQLIADDTVAEGDKVAVRATFRCPRRTRPRPKKPQHTGRLLPRQAPIRFQTRT